MTAEYVAGAVGASPSPGMAPATDYAIGPDSDVDEGGLGGAQFAQSEGGGGSDSGCQSGDCTVLLVHWAEEAASFFEDIVNFFEGLFGGGSQHVVVPPGYYRAAHYPAMYFITDSAADIQQFTPHQREKSHAIEIINGILLLAGAIVAPEVEGPALIAETAIELVEDAGEVTTVIGRVRDLETLAKGEQSLLERLTPDLGSPKANWARNSGVLRQEMARGLPIRDASPGDTGGQFLNAERNLLIDRGWMFDPDTNYWIPPAK